MQTCDVHVSKLFASPIQLGHPFSSVATCVAVIPAAEGAPALCDGARALCDGAPALCDGARARGERARARGEAATDGSSGAAVAAAGAESHAKDDCIGATELLQGCAELINRKFCSYSYPQAFQFYASGMFFGLFSQARVF